MDTDPRTNARHGRRWALWLVLFIGVVLHSSLCPSGVHAGVVTATTRTCAATAVDVAEAVEEGRPAARAVDADRPCAPLPGPHRHAPCGLVTHRAAPQDRPAVRWPAGAPPRCVPSAAGAGSACGPGGGRPRGSSSAPAAPRSGAGLLADLCASRT